MSSAFGASGLFVPFVVWLIDAFHWRTALIILGVGLWSLGIPLSFVVRNKPKRQDPLWDGEHPGQPVSSQQIQAKKVEFGLRDVMKNRSFIYLILIETIRMMAVSAVILHVMPCLCHAGVSRPTAGLIAAFLPVWSIAGRFVFGWIADVFEKKYVMAMAYFFMCVGLVGFSYVQVKWLMFLFVLLYPLGFGGAMVVRGVLLRDYFGTASFGSMLGIVMGTASVGGMIGPTLAGWVFDSIGSYQFIWLVLSGLTFLATVMTLGMRKP
jgi:cyanate permease